MDENALIYGWLDGGQLLLEIINRFFPDVLHVWHTHIFSAR